MLARLTAVAAVAAGVILAPVAFGGFDAERLDLIADSRGPDRSVADPASTDDENDRDDDDAGDDEDGLVDDYLGDDDPGDDDAGGDD